jgi:hypothetical protein
MHRGYVKLWRKIFDNPILKGHSNKFAVWIALLTMANHKEHDELFGGKRITCQPGQFTTGCKQISELCGVPRRTVQDVLNMFEIHQQISQQIKRTNRLISITNWNKYQDDHQPIRQPSANHPPTIRQPSATLKELKNDNNDKNDKNKHMCSRTTIFIVPGVEEIKKYCEERKNFVNAETFFDFYESKGWKIGKNQMKDWKAAVRTWERNENKNTKSAYEKEQEILKQRFLRGERI